jgi:hypothetical protein
MASISLCAYCKFRRLKAECLPVFTSVLHYVASPQGGEVTPVFVGVGLLRRVDARQSFKQG